MDLKGQGAAAGPDSSTPKISTADMPDVSAAQYIRMSTEHQKYSTQNQLETIQESAANRGYRLGACPRNGFRGFMGR